MYCDDNIKIEKRMPDDFVNVEKEIGGIKKDIVYFSGDNFVGRKIKGYNEPVCLLTKSATESLKKVVNILHPMGLTLKLYDCYRPKSAVDDFISWSDEKDNPKIRSIFYPSINKKDILEYGYIAKKSSHSRGSTVDLTIIPIVDDPDWIVLKSSKNKRKNTLPRELIDFGTRFDFFDEQSNFTYTDISAQAKSNRLLLRLLMENAGFKGLNTEWWHFTLINEPYPDTYFDFPVCY